MASAQRKVRHPARFSDPILDVLAERIPDGALAFDPFAGTGKVYQIEHAYWFGMEIEKEWAQLAPQTMWGDVLHDIPEFAWAGFFDVIATSPCYGNRYADKHNARDGSERRSYKHDLGHDLDPNNSGGLQWGQEYREFHIAAWPLIVDTLSVGGLFLLNISNHIRNGQEMPVWEWHVNYLIKHCGLKLITVIPIPTPRMRKGQNHKVRVNNEYVFEFERVT